MTKSFENALVFFFQRRKQQEQYASIREMSLLGGKWIGERLKWSDPYDDEPIRLEIFHATPIEILDRADEMLAIEYPILRKQIRPKEFGALFHNIVTFTLRNTHNELLAIASLKLPNNAAEGAFIRQIVVAKKLRGARNGTFLLNELESYASNAFINEIAIKTLHFMANAFYLNKGYRRVISREIELGTKLILYKKLSRYNTPPRCSPRVSPKFL